MFRSWKTFMALATVLSVLVAACGGGGGGGAGDTDDTTRQISNEELAGMVLELGQFGPEFAGFVPEEGSGPLSLEQTAEEEDDPAVEKIDLEQFGWAATHKGSFESAQSVEGQAAGLGSIVYLFDTTDGASGYFSDSMAEIKESSNQEGVNKFEKADLNVAHEGARLEIEVSVPRDDGSSVAFWATAAAFRRGRLLGVISLYAVNASDEEKQRLGGMAEALASTMNDRVASVLAAGTVAPAAAGQ